MTRSVDSDADFGSSMDDWGHNIWNPLLDRFGSVQNWASVAEIPARRRGRARGNHEPFRSGCDVARREFWLEMHCRGQESNS